MQFPLLFTDGIHVLLITIVALISGFIFWRPLFYSAFIFLIFSFYFFRNPARCNPDALHNPHLILAPADGKVIAVTHDTLDAQEYAYRISIFLSVWDVHINWTPIAGTIESIHYRPGTFTLAWLSKSAQENERNELQIKSDNGNSILVRQIAGTIARKISCWVKPHERLEVCQKIGMIRFGSRVDLFLPAHVKILVAEGDRVVGGATVVAEFM
ncbi:MAG: Phosphatidylserine decarboxylase proenzyme [uncultured bacterium]|nr:MAG: Phosphatidylserine decarboxylase proenzyme [uncultured bacterium]